jgi:hypothetical protein
VKPAAGLAGSGRPPDTRALAASPQQPGSWQKIRCENHKVLIIARPLLMCSHVPRARAAHERVRRILASRTQTASRA